MSFGKIEGCNCPEVKYIVTENIKGAKHKPKNRYPGFLFIYGSAFNLLKAVEKEHFGGGGDSYEAMLNCDLLVIDDLGTEFISQFTQTTLYGLINTRILSKKPTIINTNLSMGEIAKRYTDRISSRLIGCYQTRRFVGKDVRQMKAMQIN